MRRLTGIAPLILYAALSIALFGRGIMSGTVFQPGTDPIAYIWFLNWWPFAISHGINPLVSHYVWAPTGFPMLWANSIPTLALIMAPVTVLAGPETSWNILCLASPALSAYTCFWLLRYLFGRWLPALLGGLVFGFSAYMGSHMLGHVSLTFVPLVPLIALVTVMRARGDLGRKPFIAALSALVVLQFGISMEVLATTAFFGALTYAAFLGCDHDVDMAGLAEDVAISAAVCLPILFPAFYSLLRTAAQLPAVINSPIAFSNDSAGFVTPMETIWMGGAFATPLTSKFSATASEQNAYLGVPLLAVFLVALWSLRRETWARKVGILVGIAAVMSLGPILWVYGRPTYIPMPGAIATLLPILRHALPGRFAMYTSLGMAVLTTAWLSRYSSIAHYAAMTLAVIFILPNPGAFTWVSYDTPAVFAHPDVVRGNVLYLPFGRWGNSMLWQIRANMGFRMAGGYVGSTPKAFESLPALAYFDDQYARNLPSDQAVFERDVLAFCKMAGVGTIIVDQGTPPRLAMMLYDLGWQTDKAGLADVLYVPN